MRYLVFFIHMTFFITACVSPGADRRDLDINQNETEMPTMVIGDQSIRSFDDCPVTKNGMLTFVPSAPGNKDLIGQFWFGTDQLWTSLPESGDWKGLPLSSEGYSQKTFWWSEGYSAVDEPDPDLRVTGARLDYPAINLQASRATHAITAATGSAMLVGVVLPSTGCWEITGKFKEGSLTYVIWVE